MIKAFISYSHKDSESLAVLHKHLALLKREGLISMWTDNEIPAGGVVDKHISYELDNSNLFIALLSADYIDSNYCYEKEFEKALAMQKEDKLIIVPVIIEPCDWLNTPFQEFKALPKDGKAVNTWENKNNAFLDVAQNIRRLITSPNTGGFNATLPTKAAGKSASRNYRVKQDFDSIQKLEFIEKSFIEIIEQLKRNINEITELENIKSRVIRETKNDFECWLVNRNKIDTESQLSLSIGGAQNIIGFSTSAEKGIIYSIGQPNTRNNSSKNFSLFFDEFHMFWVQNDFFGGSRERKELGSKEIAEVIWNEWLESVGII